MYPYFLYIRSDLAKYNKMKKRAVRCQMLWKIVPEHVQNDFDRSPNTPLQKEQEEEIQSSRVYQPKGWKTENAG